MAAQGSETFIKEWLDLKMVRGRYSAILVTQLADHWEQRTANVGAILDEFDALERPRTIRATRTKKSGAFKKPPLSGLRHKHFFQSAFILQNVQNHWTGGKTPASAHEFVLDGFQARARSREITGEWIVYAVVGGVSFYLTLGKHDDDPAIATCAQLCLVEFPEIRKVWTPDLSAISG